MNKSIHHVQLAVVILSHVLSEVLQLNSKHHANETDVVENYEPKENTTMLKLHTTALVLVVSTLVVSSIGKPLDATNVSLSSPPMLHFF